MEVKKYIGDEKDKSSTAGKRQYSKIDVQSNWRNIRQGGENECMENMGDETKRNERDESKH